MTTLKPLFRALGWFTADQQRAAVKLLHAAGAFGELPGVSGMLTDAQAEAIRNQVDFPSGDAALGWLRDVTQAHLLRPAGVERCDMAEPEMLRRNRYALMPLLEKLGQLEQRTPMYQQYDHVLVMGAMQDAVDARLDTLNALRKQGVRFGEVHLLGSARPLDGRHESSAQATEAAMMEELYKKKTTGVPRSQNFSVISAPMHADGSRADAADTLRQWLSERKPRPGRVLIISGQPHSGYHEAVARAILPAGFEIDVAAPAADMQNLKIGVAADSLARQIYAGFEPLRRRVHIEEQIREVTDGLVAIRPEAIEADPAIFQFRKNGDAQGVTAAARITRTEWNPLLDAEPLTVYQYANGRTVVGDGHHRLSHLRELAAQGKAPEWVAAKIIREEDGYTPQDARIICAMVNMQHGHAGVAESARVLQEAKAPGVHRELLPPLDMTKGNLPTAQALAGASEKDLAVAEYVEKRSELAKDRLGGAVARLLADRAAKDTTERSVV